MFPAIKFCYHSGWCELRMDVQCINMKSSSSFSTITLTAGATGSSTQKWACYLVEFKTQRMYHYAHTLSIRLVWTEEWRVKKHVTITPKPLQMWQFGDSELGGWVYDPTLRVTCPTDPCSVLKCGFRAQCVYDSTKQAHCVCRPGYTGNALKRCYPKVCVGPLFK